jgi:hypothetical protein
MADGGGRGSGAEQLLDTLQEQCPKNLSKKARLQNMLVGTFIFSKFLA